MKTYSIKETIKCTGCTRGQLDRMAFDGKIEICNGTISAEYVDILVEEKERYISLLEYALTHTKGRFNGKKSSDRDKLRDIIEQHEHYGLEVHYPDEMLSGTSRDGLFFQRDEVWKLDGKLQTFFQVFGLMEKEKIDRLFHNTSGHTQSKKYLKKFMQETGMEITPAATEFVSLILSVPDICFLTDKGLQILVTKEMPEMTRDYLISFCNYVKCRQSVKYSTVSRKKKERIGMPAYSDDTYILLARCLFNAEYIYKNRMIENAMENHIYAETWLYLSLFFVCGWRAADICRSWVYPEIRKEPERWNLCLDTLDKDILEDNIPETTYEQVCQYSLQRLQVSGKIPGKTAEHDPSFLTAFITPELHPFYGLLILIGESHYLRSGDGHMQVKRAPVYQNKMTIRNFFGETAYQVLGGENIQTRRLNKDYLQGIEDNVRRSGCGGLMASAVASYARNHTNLDTLKSYLRDHHLTAESADMVLYFMLQRGCFGFEGYNLLITAYPDAFRKLTMKEQNRILSMTDAPLEMENTASGVSAAAAIQDAYIHGEKDTVLNMMKKMYEISQNRGQGKDKGIYCLRRAGKEICSHPDYESCLANGCPYLVFTKYGYRPLLRVLKGFKEEAVKGDKKAASILYKVLVPRYQDILNQLMKETAMDPEEKNSLKLMMKEELNG